MILTFKVILFSTFLYFALSRHMDFRERFLERKRLRALKDQRVTVLNKMLKNTIILDEITHYRKIKGKSSKKVRAIEKDFRRLLAMQGMKYNYKRDLFWRTWRSVPLVNGATKDIVCYKCNNLKLADGTACQSCGTWTIEDSTPPCPFEFFSLVSDEKFCGANISQYKDIKHNCPSVIKFSDLTATCDNPIETHWRFTKMYGVTEEYEDVICNNQDFCEIFTSYEITPEHVVFRIVNSTNDVIYSRIMKPKNKNYICIEDCGRFNPVTKKVAKRDGKPLKLNLLARKMKRNDLLNETIMKTALLNEINENITKHEGFMKRNDKKREKLLNEINDIVVKRKVLFNESNEGDTTLIVTKINDNVTKREHLNEINDNVTKKNLVDERNNNYRIWEEFLNLNNSNTKNRLVNGINDNVTKRKQLNETNDNVTKKNLMDERNNKYRKWEQLFNKNNTKNRLVIGIKDNVTRKITHLNEHNNKKRPVKEINVHNAKRNEPHDESDAYEEIVIETTESDDAKTEELINDMNESQSNDKYVSNESTHLTGTKPEKILNELLPMEENLSKMDWGATKFDLVSIEVNSVHNIKSRGKHNNLAFRKQKALRKPTSPKSSMASEEINSLNSILHKPTLTPRFNLKKKENFTSYEDANEEVVYS